MNEESESNKVMEPNDSIKVNSDKGPDEGVKTVDGVKKTNPNKKNKNLVKPILLIALVLVLIGLAAGAAYLLRDDTANKLDKKQTAEILSLEKSMATLKKQLAALKAKDTSNTVADQTPCTAIAPTATVIESIKASITSGNTAALEGYMAASVNVILAASEGIGPSTPSAAVASISNFITSDNTSWDYDFSLPAATLNSYGQGSYSQYFPSIAVVGKAPNNKVISFSFDCNAKISTVFMSASDDLL